MLHTHDELIANLSRSLNERRYNPVAVGNNVRYACAFLSYLTENNLPVELVTQLDVDRYICHATECFKARYGRNPSPRWHNLPRTSVYKVLALAQEQWPPKPKTVEEYVELRNAIAENFKKWMEDERGFTDMTVQAIMWESRNFLKWIIASNAKYSFTSLNIKDVDAYMDMRSVGMSRKSIAGIATRLRTLLRYLHLAKLVSVDLAPLVVGPKVYALEGVPSIMDRDQIVAVLNKTKQDRSPLGLRDYAILQILSTYGLRDGEVVRITIEDVNWRAETLRVIRRKTGTCSIFPLSSTVGEALIDYLRDGRPQVELRTIFIRSLAPYTPLLSVNSIVGRRLAAAGVDLPGKRGPHVFRHSRATELLRASVPQKIIGDLLGHRSVESSNTYLKLATEDLRGVALEVPGSEVLS